MEENIVKMVMSLDVVSLELAKRLKYYGYNKKTEYYYQDYDLPYVPKGLYRCKNGKKMNHNKYEEFIYSAPTWMQLAK